METTSQKERKKNYEKIGMGKNRILSKTVNDYQLTIIHSLSLKEEEDE
tara:strand:- start:53 stop:196 length:144 start_codon:yes stop_codon:yes gene_type:complete